MRTIMPETDGAKGPDRPRHRPTRKILRQRCVNSGKVRWPIRRNGGISRRCGGQPGTMVTSPARQQGARNAALRSPGSRRPADGGMTEPSPAATEDPPAESPGAPMASHDAPAAPAPAPAAEPASGRPGDGPAEPPATQDAAAARPGRRQRGAQALALLRRHWLFSALLAAGLVLRVLAQIAYHPALIYVDTLKYLYGASPGSEPLGYTAILRIILLAGDLGTVTAIQHLLGLAMAVALYAVLLRRGAPRWLAALAAAPVLLDAYQLQMEQMIMPDVWFEALAVAGMAVLLWRPVVDPALRGRRRADPRVRAHRHAGRRGPDRARRDLPAGRPPPAGARPSPEPRPWPARSCCVVLGCYSYTTPRTGISGWPGKQTLTGRLAAAADCATLQLPAAARPMCPTPAQQALGPDWLEHSGQSPLSSATARASRRSDRGTEQRGVQPAAAAGGGLDPPRLGPPVRPDPGRRAERHADLALAVPDRLPGLPAVGQRLPARAAGRPHLPDRSSKRSRSGWPRSATCWCGPAAPSSSACSGRRCGVFAASRLKPSYGGSGAGRPADRRVPAGLPARRRLHARPAARPVHPGRPGRLAAAAEPPPRSAAPASSAWPACCSPAPRSLVLAGPGRLRVLLAIRAARRGHPGTGWAARHLDTAQLP